MSNKRAPFHAGKLPPPPVTTDPTAGEHQRVSNGPDALDTCTGCDWESWDTAPSFAAHVTPGAGEREPCWRGPEPRLPDPGRGIES